MKIGVLSLLLAAGMGIAAKADAARVYYLVGVRHVYQINNYPDPMVSDRQQIEMEYAAAVQAAQDKFDQDMHSITDEEQQDNGAVHQADRDAVQQNIEAAMAEAADKRDESLAHFYPQVDSVREGHPELAVDEDGPYRVMGINVGPSNVYQDVVFYQPYPLYVDVCPFGWTWGRPYAFVTFGFEWRHYHTVWVSSGCPFYAPFYYGGRRIEVSAPIRREVIINRSGWSHGRPPMITSVQRQTVARNLGLQVQRGVIRDPGHVQHVNVITRGVGGNVRVNGTGVSTGSRYSGGVNRGTVNTSGSRYSNGRSGVSSGGVSTGSRYGNGSSSRGTSTNTTTNTTGSRYGNGSGSSTGSRYGNGGTNNTTGSRYGRTGTSGTGSVGTASTGTGTTGSRYGTGQSGVGTTGSSTTGSSSTGSRYGSGRTGSGTTGTGTTGSSTSGSSSTGSRYGSGRTGSGTTGTGTTGSSTTGSSSTGSRYGSGRTGSGTTGTGTTGSSTSGSSSTGSRYGSGRTGSGSSGTSTGSYGGSRSSGSSSTGSSRSSGSSGSSSSGSSRGSSGSSSSSSSGSKKKGGG